MLAWTCSRTWVSLACAVAAWFASSTGSGLGRGVVTRVLVGVGSEAALVFSGRGWASKTTVEVGLGERAGWGVGKAVAETEGCQFQGCITLKQTRIMIKTGKI